MLKGGERRVAENPLVEWKEPRLAEEVQLDDVHALVGEGRFRIVRLQAQHNGAALHPSIDQGVIGADNVSELLEKDRCAGRECPANFEG